MSDRMSDQSDKTYPSHSWIRYSGPGGDTLAPDIEQRMKDHLSRGKYTVGELEGIKHFKLSLLPSTTKLSEERLEKIRKLSHLWEVDIRVSNITSHRPVIGPLIVAAKKILMPFIRLALADMIRQQREFNAEALGLIMELSADVADK